MKKKTKSREKKLTDTQLWFLEISFISTMQSKMIKFLHAKFENIEAVQYNHLL